MKSAIPIDTQLRYDR